jgi:hypothetical protein
MVMLPDEAATVTLLLPKVIVLLIVWVLTLLLVTPLLMVSAFKLPPVMVKFVAVESKVMLLKTPWAALLLLFGVGRMVPAKTRSSPTAGVVLLAQLEAVRMLLPLLNPLHVTVAE